MKTSTMISVTLDKIGKQYNSDWIFADISCTLSPKDPTVILGANGSGKSTLLQIILSAATPTLGKIEYFNNQKPVAVEDVFKLMAISAPYIELIEEFTLLEMITFHGNLKPFVRNLSTRQIIDICRLNKSSDKLIRNFSSGMKQRAKLALAVLSDVPVILLDEPTSNLDQAGIDWYNELIANNINGRTVVISSNSVAHEYNFCTQQINLEHHKHIPETDPSLLLF